MFQNKNFYFTCNGKIIHKEEVAANCIFLQAHLRIPGGKGGFGSMLRAIGARIEKTTNHEACRDLNGRRMRDVNNEKKIADWLQSQDEKEKERLQKRQQRVERILNPTTRYEDVDYTASLQGNAQKIEDALKAAKTTKPGTKRKTEKPEKDPKSKRGRMWTGMADLTDGSEDSENEEEPIPSVPEAEAALAKSDTEKQPVTGQENKIESENVKNKKTKKTTDSKTVVKTNKSTEDDTNVEKPTELIDLNDYKDVDQLQALGLECLKHELKTRGLKCGGTLQERAERLFRTKNVPKEELDSSLFPSNNKK